MNYTCEHLITYVTPRSSCTACAILISVYHPGAPPLAPKAEPPPPPAAAMSPAKLTAEALAAHDAGSGYSSHLEFEDSTMRALEDAEASAARREHVLALLKEFEQLKALAPGEASGWQQRRERAAACYVQAAWRRRSSRRTFLQVVQHSQLQLRAKAVTTIQRAQRTRTRVFKEEAPPISAELVERLQRELVETTIAKAREFKAARQARQEWAAGGGPAGEGVEPALPDWYVAPAWQIEAMRSSASPLVQELRTTAIRGHQSDGSQAEMLRALRDWRGLRAQMQVRAPRASRMRWSAFLAHTARA